MKTRKKRDPSMRAWNSFSVKRGGKRWWNSSGRNFRRDVFRPGIIVFLKEGGVFKGKG